MQTCYACRENEYYLRSTFPASTKEALIRLVSGTGSSMSIIEGSPKEIVVCDRMFYEVFEACANT